MLELKVKSAVFRIASLALGLIILVTSALVHSVVDYAVAVGVLFGGGGFLFDYGTQSRYGRGQASAWAVVAGGFLIGVYWRYFLPADELAAPVWAVGLQYLATVLICWGLLMLLLERRSSPTS